MTTKNYGDAKADGASPFITRGKYTGTTQDRRLSTITRRIGDTAWRQRGRVTTFVAGIAALAVATLGFASAAGAAGNAPRLEKPAVIEGASSSTYLAGYQAIPNGGLASASVTFIVPALSCTAKDDGANEWTGVYTDSLQTWALVDDYCTSNGPGYNYEFKTLAGRLQQARCSGG